MILQEIQTEINKLEQDRDHVNTILTDLRLKAEALSSSVALYEKNTSSISNSTVQVNEDALENINGLISNVEVKLFEVDKQIIELEDNLSDIISQIPVAYRDSQNTGPVNINASYGEIDKTITEKANQHKTEEIDYPLGFMFHATSTWGNQAELVDKSVQFNNIERVDPTVSPEKEESNRESFLRKIEGIVEKVKFVADALEVAHQLVSPYSGLDPDEILRNTINDETQIVQVVSAEFTQSLNTNEPSYPESEGLDDSLEDYYADIKENEQKEYKKDAKYIQISNQDFDKMMQAANDKRQEVQKELKKDDWLYR